jgi:hypothetical protein
MQQSIAMYQVGTLIVCLFRLVQRIISDRQLRCSYLGPEESISVFCRMWTFPVELELSYV